MGIQEYRQFIASKATTIRKNGMQPKPINDMAKVHQHAALTYALEVGKSAAFLDTGLGKSFIELEWARQVSEETGVRGAGQPQLAGRRAARR